MTKFGIIAGTGYDNILDGFEKKIFETAYGQAEGAIKGDVVIMQRHGKGHSVPPHKINYRANIQAMKDLGVQYIFGICAVGSVKKDLPPGSLILNNDFLDFTKNRITTFFDGDDGIVEHLEVSEPYNEELNDLFIKIAKENNCKINGKGVYVCTEGPRFETKTEIKMYQYLDCHVCGMTNVPEVLLANERQIVYSCLSFVTNFCTGVGGEISEEEIKSVNFDKKKLLDTILKTFESPEILKIKSKAKLI